ncbi:hypothetical protein GCM10010124_28040 [Pilimelia terevasa]|uniref:YcaO domain-containing protein n=1 Tax=Pilimelia terevasa TaxID=53372 RepID=A0A8J3BNE1_9ACTN|nr:YcaO-like family protein [Pilimelia terevasa]GGK33897.1 hypothetical protein GCM10010124_28040 [Pilimelia terevasa]
MTAPSDVVYVADDVRLHVLDDREGFLETAAQVRRIRGARLTVLAERLLPRLRTPTAVGQLVRDLAAEVPEEELTMLLRGLSAHGVLSTGARPVDGRPAGRFAVHGPPALTDQLVALLGRLPGTEVRSAGEEPAPARDGELAVVGTTSLFDPRTGALHAALVAQRRPHLAYGLAQDGAAFVGPLWTPTRLSACFHCLRTRLFSHAVNGPTLRAYARFLAESGAAPVPQAAPPWTVARLIGAVARRALAWSAAPEADDAQELRWCAGPDDEGGTRRLLPVPTCACADGAPPPEPVAGLADAEDPVVGIVHAVSVRRAESGPAIYLGGSTSANFALLREPMRVTRNGGAGFTRAAALASTVGESLERYAAGLYRRDTLRLATWTALAAAGEEAVHPDRFGLFSPAQYAEPDFPFVPFAADTPLRWARAARLGTDEPVWVPASQAHLHYRRVPGEAAIGPSISTGLAAGPSWEQAVLGGLCEVVERDALAVSWLYRLPPRPVAPGVVAASSAVSHLLREATSWRVRFYDLSLDLRAPVVAAVMEHRGAHGAIMSFGSACRWSPVRAVEKAFLEAAQGLTYVRRLLRQHEDWQVAPDFSNVDDFNLHAILYSRYPELRTRAGYLVHPTEPVACTRPPSVTEVPADLGPADELAAVAGAVRAAGHDIAVLDLSTPDVRQLGVHVVRVLVPGLQHLSGTHRQRFLGSPRLAQVAERLALASAPDNPFPHPLP